VRKGEKMKPGYSLQLLQSQRLSLTPELRQAIMVLQMNALELTEFLRAQAEDNPLLEVNEDSWDESLPEPEILQEPSDPALDESYFPQEPRYSDARERLTETRISLRQHLMSQLGLMPLTEKEYDACEFVVGNIDDNGYLVASEEEIAISSGFPVSLISKVSEIVRTLDPSGVGARNLKECLLIQAKDRAESPLVLALIERHLEDLGAGRYKKIAKEENVPLKDVLAAREVVLSLDPKPGSRFSTQKPGYVVPDVYVEREGDRLLVRYNEKAVPRVRYNAYYMRLLESGDADTRAYLADRLRRAKALVGSIQERRATMLRVMNCLISHQKRFFTEGPLQVRPLTLREIASELSMHESTVSRSLSNKFIGTPFGTFPCKMLLSSRVQSNGEDISQHAVKKLVQEMVMAEDPRDPLSDQQIAENLSRLGLKVARRTVAKYRAMLGIQPSSRRRKA